MRAASAACTVSGRLPLALALPAPRVRAISSRKNGLPSARATIAACSPSSPLPSSSSSASALLSAVSSGSTASPVKRIRPPPQVGCRDVSSGRAVHSTKTGPEA